MFARIFSPIELGPKFDGCGIASFWQPSCVWMGGYDNFTVRNNDMSNNPFALLRIRSHTPHGSAYWDDVVEPTREDYVFHVEFNHFYDYGLGILSDFGAVYIGEGVMRQPSRPHFPL